MVCDLENKLSKAVRVFVIQQQGVAGIGCPRLEQQQEKLITWHAHLEKTQQYLQNTAQLQHRKHKHNQ